MTAPGLNLAHGALKSALSDVIPAGKSSLASCRWSPAAGAALLSRLAMLFSSRTSGSCVSVRLTRDIPRARRTLPPCNQIQGRTLGCPQYCPQEYLSVPAHLAETAGRGTKNLTALDRETRLFFVAGGT